MVDTNVLKRTGFDSIKQILHLSHHNKEMRKLLFSIALFLLALPVSAQSVKEIEAKYGYSFKAYLIRPTVMMTVKYAENGQVTEMLVAPRIEDISNPTIAPLIVREIVEELAPTALRGAKLTAPEKKLPYSLNIKFPKSTDVEEYENVSITYRIRNEPNQCSGVAVIIIKWKR